MFVHLSRFFGTPLHFFGTPLHSIVTFQIGFQNIENITQKFDKNYIGPNESMAPIPFSPSYIN